MELVPFGGFPDGSVVKNPHANAGDADVSSIPGSGRSPGEGNGNPVQCYSWKAPWTEEPGGLQFTGLRRVGCDLVTENEQKHKELLC